MVTSDTFEEMEGNSAFTYNNVLSSLPQAPTINPMAFFSTTHDSLSDLPDLSQDGFNTNRPESAFESPAFDKICSVALNSSDSAVDLSSQAPEFHLLPATVNPKNLRLDTNTHTIATPMIPTASFEVGESSSVSNTPSPVADAIFSANNSPRAFPGEDSLSTSREASTDVTTGPWPMDASTPDAVYMSHTSSPRHLQDLQEPREQPRVYLAPDKTKTRAETQIKVTLTLDPIDGLYNYISFPRKTLAKPKFLMSSQDKAEFVPKGKPLHMDLRLVCATAIEDEDNRNIALRRARGEEAVPRRDADTSFSDLDKDDPAHPQNGGEVLICDGCRERERKRYDRKKKKSDDESEWLSYEADRVIIINEKEYKKFKDIDSPTLDPLSPGARQVEFAMRIACYCRHQEEKSPVGYRVILTFKDGAGKLVTQHVSEIFQITDDHKNKENPQEIMTGPMSMTQHYVGHYHPAPAPGIIVPQTYSPYMENSYTMGSYSQPQTPLEAHFSPPVTPTTTMMPVHQTFSHFSSSSASVTAPHFPRPPPPQPRYDVPLASPTGAASHESFLIRPQSMENFGNYNFNMPQNWHFPSQGFASAPPSGVATPINLSRPASPTWEQGPQFKKHQQVGF